LQPVRPFVPADVRLAELTPRTLLIGVMLGVVFGASSLYLVLKVGLTISASLPVAVIAVTLFRLAHKAGARDSTILENNIVQTAGSAGESIAFGLGMTMPAILILGFDLDIARVMMVAVLGSLPGILLMIPLRRTLIVAQHGELKDPEGTACAEVLKAAATDASRAAAERPAAGSGAGFDAGSRAGTIFIGFCVGLAYKVANIALKGWKDVPGVVFDVPYRGASLAAEVSPELLGVGYIIGPRIASIMCAGGVLAYLVLIPLIKFFGDALSAPLAPGGKPILAMSPNESRGAYVLHIGAGALLSALALGPVLLKLNDAATVYVPILVGGLVRRFVDRRNSRLPRHAPMTEEERIAASESRAGVLLASGYIAGGALAGIVIAIAAGVLTGFDRALGEWAVRNNPLFAGPNADLLSLIPFVALVVLLYWTARERYR
jgi:uncharacterized oligopeptide transporter (OPT) family protein